MGNDLFSGIDALFNTILVMGISSIGIVAAFASILVETRAGVFDPTSSAAFLSKDWREDTLEGLGDAEAASLLFLEDIMSQCYEVIPENKRQYHLSDF